MNSKISLNDFMTPTWLLIVVGLLVGGAAGLYEMFLGHSFATNSAMVWTLPLVTYVFLALMSTGVSIVIAYGVLARKSQILERTRALLILAIGLLMGAFTALATELGSLLNMIWILLSPNPISPIWWMGALYSVELVLLVVKLVMDLMGRHGPLDRPLAWATLIVASAAAMMIGAVFGTVIGRADYVGMYTSLFTLPVALLAGVAVIILTQPQGRMTEMLTTAYRQFAVLWIILLGLKLFYDAHSSVPALQGWVDIWTILPFVFIALFAGYAPRILATFGLIASLWIAYNFVLTGQLVSLGPAAGWFGPIQVYRPNLPEIAILILGIAVAAALIKLGYQYLIGKGLVFSHARGCQPLAGQRMSPSRSRKRSFRRWLPSTVMAEPVIGFPIIRNSTGTRSSEGRRTTASPERRPLNSQPSMPTDSTSSSARVSSRSISVSAVFTCWVTNHSPPT
ncbi:MAG: polysulfide reductase [Thioalkalivibrio sp.]|nr:polysulfide reductase [Thioalkalivibrio sp.]